MRINYWHPFEENGYYHIYNRSNNKETIFLSDENYLFFLRQWNKYLGNYFWTHSYALIPNHFHFTVKIRPVNTQFKEATAKENTVAGKGFSKGEITLDVFLEDQMKRFLSSYAKAFNKQQGRKGSLFQKRFKRIGIKNENHLVYMVTYHHHNPIHHKLVKIYTAWKYSSYQAILSEAPTQICRDEVLQLFDIKDQESAKRKFIQYHEDSRLDRKMDFLMMED